MSVCVIDTSVVIKWYLTESDTVCALGLLSGDWDLHAPEYLQVELDSVLLKYYRRKELSLKETQNIRNAFRETPIVIHPNTPLVDSAFSLAAQTRISNYDAIFLALALALNAEVMTADKKLVNALYHTPLSNRVLLLNSNSK